MATETCTDHDEWLCSTDSPNALCVRGGLWFWHVTPKRTCVLYARVCVYARSSHHIVPHIPSCAPVCHSTDVTYRNPSHVGFDTAFAWCERTRSGLRWTFPMDWYDRGTVIRSTQIKHLFFLSNILRIWFYSQSNLIQFVDSCDTNR